jgi:very-short-patch-repair endonuclease
MSKYTKEEFIEKARKKHGDKYDYSQVDYIDSQTKVAIICHEKDLLGNEHGIFWQMPYSHLQGFRCPRCNGRKKTTEQWIMEAKSVYPEGRYTFEKTEYLHARNKLIVTCSEHGDFLTLPRDFLRGHGCPKCNMPKLEVNTEKALNENNISFKMQVKFKWLNGMSFDFYLPDYKIAIECQGEQHYINKEFFNKREDLKERQKRDFQKRQLCKENGVELIYFLEPKFEEYETSGNKYFTNVDDLIDYNKEQIPIE